jgi:hypothetical protein
MEAVYGMYASVFKYLVRKSGGKKLLGRQRLRGLDNVKIDLKVRGCGLNLFGSEQVSIGS